MKIVRKQDAERHTNSEQCTAFEYPLGDKDINGAVIELNGNYPEKGQAVNVECKELAYIVSGSGKLIMDDEVVDFSAGDLIFIDKGEKYRWEGAATMFMPCVPAWYPEQHKMVDNG